jgi:hypothetical protein
MATLEQGCYLTPFCAVTESLCLQDHLLLLVKCYCRLSIVNRIRCIQLTGVVQTTSAVFATEMRISSFAALRICAGTFTLCAKCEMILASKLATLVRIERESSVARATIGLEGMVEIRGDWFDIR